MTPEPAVLSFLEKHPVTAQILATGFNPYLRDGNGQQHNWNVSLMFPERMTSMSVYFSTASQIGEEAEKPSVSEVLTGLVQEARLLAGAPTPQAFAEALNLQADGLYEQADAAFLHQAARRRTFQLQALLGDQFFTKLMSGVHPEVGDTGETTPESLEKVEADVSPSSEEGREDANAPLDSAEDGANSPAVETQDERLPPSTQGADLLDIDAW